MNKCGYILRDKRKEMHLSMQQVADSAGVSRQCVSKLESDQCIPKVNTLIKICCVLSLDPIETCNEYIKERNHG